MKLIAQVKAEETAETVSLKKKKNIVWKKEKNP